MNDLAHHVPDLNALIALFYQSQEELGRFERAHPKKVPGDYATLLAHEKHMTVTVERFHNSPVDVRVLQTNLTGNRYARKILLTRRSDGEVVQFGIMRVNFAYLDDDVRREIESQNTPLGRILIEHNVLREIFLFDLWKVEPGTELCRFFALKRPQTTYGRTAIIECNGEPAIELLEIVAPVEKIEA